MNTQYSHNTQTIIYPTYNGGEATGTHLETQQLLSLGRQQGWDVNIIGRAPLPDGPVRLGDWLLVPSWQDTSSIPARALARVQAIYDAGIRPVGFVLAHEAPRQLPPPAEAVPQTDSTWQRPSLPDWFVPALRVAASALVVLAVGAVIITGVILVATAILAVAAVLAVPALLITTAIVLDPILIAVTEDGTWIEIDRWYT